MEEKHDEEGQHTFKPNGEKEACVIVITASFCPFFSLPCARMCARPHTHTHITDITEIMIGYAHAHTHTQTYIHTQTHT